MLVFTHRTRARKNAAAVCPIEVGAPETGIHRDNATFLTPQDEHLIPGT
jgi:hypothetical protein